MRTENSMKQKLLLIAFVLSLPFGAIHAEEYLFAAYKNVGDIVVPVVVVPTVVEVPLDSNEIRERGVVVFEEQTESVIASEYRKDVQSQAVGVVVTDGSGRILSALTDTDVETVVTFPLVDDTWTETVLQFSFDRPVESLQLQLALDSNVALPNSIKIVARDISSGQPVTIVSPIKMQSGYVSFLETIARDWEITLFHSQPLRLTSAKLVEKSTGYITEGSVRFLAQPDLTYKIYANADRAVSLQTKEGGRLQDDKEVLQVGKVSLKENPAYVPADVDGDSIIDIFDNCVSVANPDQEDVDKNERGDACDDFDRDGRINSLDNCRDIPNRNQVDTDGDGIGDDCDEEESRLTEQNPWIAWVSLGFAGIAIAVMFFIVWSQSKKKEEIISSDEEETVI